MHLVMSPLEFMQVSIEWPLRDGEVQCFYVGSGSTSDGEAQRQR